jgi:hypothetical protein
VNLPFGVEVFEAAEEFTADDRNMWFGEIAGFRF